MQNERQRHGSFLPCTPQIFSIKRANCIFCCVGTYRDASPLWSLRFGFLACGRRCTKFPSHLCLCVFVLGFMRAFPLAECVCCDGGATRVRDRGERNAWANPPRPPRCCWLSPTLCWVDGIHGPSLWWSSCMWCASHIVWMVFLLRVPVISVRNFLHSYSSPFSLFVSIQL
ncbi:putative retrotransposon hot spot protein (RHS) [Trypanosoma cruzi]|uniref:Putative retrotransposon hot spot protein (RHS) n=1 Tax=Trypanosoma cruzi TaxID=5693 RepID=A0A2V2WGI6_TRYCR|nr:putative retrotransposon hot spot protein (RHS) [Trypanosoma cruzi]